MHHVDIANSPASRSAVAYDPYDRAANLSKLMTALVPALGILAACAVMLNTIV